MKYEEFKEEVERVPLEKGKPTSSYSSRGASMTKFSACR